MKAMDKQIECPECNGVGEREYYVGVIDWKHGGELVGEMDTCEMCDGNGEITIDEGEDDD